VSEFLYIFEALSHGFALLMAPYAVVLQQFHLFHRFPIVAKTLQM
jgi:hypothetical protein